MQFSYLLLYATILLSSQCVCYVNDENDNGINDPIPSQITVTSWNDMPYSGIEQHDGKWIGKGYAFEIFNLISSKLNFTYTIIPPNKHVLGDEKNGILSVLYQKKADVAVAFLPMLLNMRRYCEFSTSLDQTKLTAMMKRPQISATGSGLLAPFEKTVWLLVLTSLICIGPIIYIFARISSKLWNDTTAQNFTLFSCFWFAYSSFLKQGSTIVATTNSIRILFATWWIFILILTSFYTANLTAFLTKPQFTLSISSLQDIVYLGYNWIALKGRTVEFLLSQNYESDLSLLRKSKVQRKGTFKHYERSEDILNDIGTRSLFLSEAHYLQTLLFENYINDTRNGLDHNHRCGYVIMPEAILIMNRAFGFPRDSVLKKRINAMLLRFVETGVIQHRKLRDLPLTEICPVDLRSSERQLQNTDLKLTYQVVAAGYTIAAIVFLFEIIYTFILHQVKHSKVKHNSHVSREKSKTSRIQKPMNDISMLKTSPMKYQGTENLMLQPKQQFINGRHYHVITDKDGDRRLIPMRTPSAFLFQSIA